MRRALSALGLLVCAACPQPAHAAAPARVVGSVIVSDSVKVTLTCAPVQASDTVYTVRCHAVLRENGATVGAFDQPMNSTQSFTYAHAALTGIPGSSVTVTVNVDQFGVNRSGQQSVATSQVLSTVYVISDMPPSAPKAVGGTIKYCPAGTSCP